MRISLLPRAIFPALTQISPDYLRRQGIRLLMLDFDNTIVPYTTDTPSHAIAGDGALAPEFGPVGNSGLRGIQQQERARAGIL